MRQPKGYTKPEEEHLVCKLSSQDPGSRSCGTATVPVSCGEPNVPLSMYKNRSCLNMRSGFLQDSRASQLDGSQTSVEVPEGDCQPSQSLSQESAWDILMQTGLGTRKTGNPHLVTYSRWLQNQCHERVESRTVLPEAEYIKFNWSTAPLVTWWSTC